MKNNSLEKAGEDFAKISSDMAFKSALEFFTERMFQAHDEMMRSHSSELTISSFTTPKKKNSNQTTQKPS